jgi:hypothetical protein
LHCISQQTLWLLAERLAVDIELWSEFIIDNKDANRAKSVLDYTDFKIHYLFCMNCVRVCLQVMLISDYTGSLLNGM